MLGITRSRREACWFWVGKKGIQTLYNPYIVYSPIPYYNPNITLFREYVGIIFPYSLLRTSKQVNGEQKDLNSARASGESSALASAWR